MSLIFIDKVKDNQAAFEQKVIDIADKLQIDPNWLMIVMESESGLSSTIQNTAHPFSNGFASGLIQFAPNTAISLGTTVDNLIAMSNVDQLDYVYKYYAPYVGRIKGVEDLWLINFFPAALNYSDDDVIKTSSIGAAAVAKSNPSFDLNKDGQITVAEFKKAIGKKLPLGYQSATGRKIMETIAPVLDKIPVVGQKTSSNPVLGVIIILLFAALIVLIIRKIHK